MVDDDAAAAAAIAIVFVSKAHKLNFTEYARGTSKT